MTRPDDEILSRYLDGELDYRTITEVTKRLGHDRDCQERLVQLVGVQARLRSMGTSIMAEEVPLPMRGVARSNRSFGSWSSKPLSRMLPASLVRYAAVLALVVLGFLSGRTVGERPESIASLFPLIPTGLQQVVNRTLEFDPSGANRNWENRKLGVRARVEPVGTFRGTKGDFYRMYILKIVEGDTVRPYVGIARRTGKEAWQTRSFFLQEGTSNI